MLPITVIIFEHSHALRTSVCVTVSFLQEVGARCDETRELHQLRCRLDAGYVSFGWRTRQHVRYKIELFRLALLRLTARLVLRYPVEPEFPVAEPTLLQHHSSAPGITTFESDPAKPPRIAAIIHRALTLAAPPTAKCVLLYHLSR